MEIATKATINKTIVLWHLRCDGDIDYHTEMDMLMMAFRQFLDEADGNWYALGKKQQRRLSKKQQLVNESFYYCMFTQKGHARIGAGDKFNNDFLKKDIPSAMCYTLYRYIKNGLEY